MLQENKDDYKVIVVSAVNFFEGGPLSVLKDCLSFLDSQNIIKKLKVVALVHDVSLFKTVDFANIELIEFPKSRKSYFYRLYFEYFYFRRIAKEKKVSFWLSLHDITPNVTTVPQAVYCHNPSPFNTINYRDIYIQPTQFFFRLFYKYLYRINIKKNKYVIVQQLWMKNAFQKMYNINPQKIIVAKPEVPLIKIEEEQRDNANDKVFFYPAFPRPFKNFEVVCKAVEILEKKGLTGFQTVLTIDGTENKYASKIVKKYKRLSSIKFVGLLSRDDVFANYRACDCLIFSSKLETWGLPISEFKQFKKKMIVSKLPYAKETVGDYDKVFFFDPENPTELSNYMEMVIEETAAYHESKVIEYPQPYTENWNELFTLLLKC